MTPARSYPGLDVVRFFAALMVAFYHLAFWWWRPSQHLGRFTAELAPLAPLVSYGWVGVPVFFVISGFVIAFSASHKTARQFAAGRALRLYPSAWICGAVTVAVAGASASQIWRTALLWPVGPWVSGVYWTLAIEIIFYALVALVMAMRGSLTNLALWLGAWSTAFWLAKAANVALGGSLNFAAIENERGYLLLAHDGVFFALGMLLFKQRQRWAALLFAGIGFAAVAWRSHAMAIPGAHFLAAPGAWAACTAAVAWCAFRNPRLEHLPTRTMGLMTYPLYLLHAELGRAVMLQIGDAWLALAAGLGTVTLAAWAVLPAEAWVRARLRPRSERPARRSADRPGSPADSRPPRPARPPARAPRASSRASTPS